MGKSLSPSVPPSRLPSSNSSLPPSLPPPSPLTFSPPQVWCRCSGGSEMSNNFLASSTWLAQSHPLQTVKPPDTTQDRTGQDRTGHGRERIIKRMAGRGS
eukprot:765358-Hanusia_phi.AAC.1